MKRRLMGLLGALLLFPLPVRAELLSIAELHRQAEEMGRWTQTYEAHGRIIEVDVPIEVPDVDKLPVLRISRERGCVDEAYFSEEEDRWVDLSGIQGMPFIGSGYDAGWRAWEDRTYSAHLNLNETLSGNIGKTAGELIDEMERTVEAYWNVDVEFQPEYVSEKTSIRAFNEKAGIWEETEDIEPYFVEDGQYMWGGVWYGLDAYAVSAYQLLHGIPLIDGMLGIVGGGSSDWDRERFANISPAVYECTANGEMGLTFSRAIETEVAYEDVPMCGFEIAKACFEKLIVSGNLRGVNAVRLGYVLCLDKDGGDCWAVPMWVLDGKYVYDADRKDKPEYDDYGAILDYARSGVAVMQNGEMVRKWNQDRNRLVVPKIVTWEDGE